MPPYFFVTRIPSQLRLAARNALRVMPSSRRSSPSRKWDCGEGGEGNVADVNRGFDGNDGPPRRKEGPSGPPPRAIWYEKTFPSQRTVSASA
jgi:hypothetical protein